MNPAPGNPVGKSGVERPVSLRRILVTGVLSGALLFGTTGVAVASTLTDDARSLRDSVVQLTQDYERDFGSRVTPAERDELTSMGAQARREMIRLVGAIRTAERTNRTADWRTARAVHEAALTTAEARFERAAAMLQPQLTLGEQLAAYSDYTRTLREFERLGQQIPTGAGR